MTTHTAGGFNAALDPWIPVVGHSGSGRVSMLDAIVHAHELKALATDDPITVLPLIRTLVALIQSADPLSSPQDFRRVWASGQFESGRIRRYVDESADRFEVFHDQHPFLQVGGLMPSSGEPKGASGLLLRVASGNNVPLFSPLTDGDKVRLSVPDALLQLVTVLGWDTAAIKTGAQGDPRVAGGKTTGNPTGPLGQLGAVIPWGRTLFETLLLNTPLIPILEDDRPAWERNLRPEWEIRQPTGILELLTWPSRRVRLVRQRDDDHVTGVIIAAGDRLLFPPEYEPHTRWRATKGDIVAHRPLRWQPGSNAWRGLDTLLTLPEGSGQGAPAPRLIHQIEPLLDVLGDTYPLNLLCLGVTYGNQSAVIEDVFVDTLPLPLAALHGDANDDVRDALREVVSNAEAIRRALNGLADNLRQIEGGDKLPWDAGVHPGNDAMAQLTSPTMRLLTGLQRDPGRFDEGLLAWQEVAEGLALTTAEGLLDRASPRAFEGRTMKIGSTERAVRLSDAEAWFRKFLREALPTLTHTRQQERGTA